MYFFRVWKPSPGMIDKIISCALALRLSSCQGERDKMREPGIEVVAFAGLTNQSEGCFLWPMRRKTKTIGDWLCRSFHDVLVSLGTFVNVLV